MINPGELLVVGFGETIFDAQEDAAHEFLTHIK
jgi:hypothetical protein